jgi:membrane dipeptidase
MKDRDFTAGARMRRRLLRSLAIAPGLMLGGPLLDVGRAAEPDTTPCKYSRRAIDLVKGSIVIDMLGLLAVNDEVRERWVGQEPGITQEEVATLRSSGITAFHHAVGIGGPDAYDVVLHYLTELNGLIARNTDRFMRIDRAADLAHAKTAGKIGVILGVQNADQFRLAEDVADFHRLGLRCAQLTYNRQNLLGSGSTERVDGGLSDFGAVIVEQMDRVGMLVDVSHCGERTTLDAIEAARGPIAITHSNCRALNDHPRLKTDEAIRKLAAKGGVMGIAGLRMFVRAREPTTLEHLVDHIDHVVQLVGIEHVGIGSDADLWGYDSLPAAALQQMRAGYKASYALRDRIDIDGFDHPRKIFDLTEVLLRRGYSDRNIAAILGGNFQRLLAQVWRG